MSVNAGDRKEGKLEVLTKSCRLASYTIKVCCNKKWFPEQYDTAITDRIVLLATGIFTKCWTANNIKADSIAKAEKRLKLQADAHDDCNELLALIQIAQQVFHLRINRIKYWGKTILEVRGLISLWNESDSRRLKNLSL